MCCHNAKGDRINVTGIVQARMGSTRLPGKVMMDLSGRAMLWHVVERLAVAEAVDQVVVATTSSARDGSISEWCADNGIPCFRGSEDDVLDRFYRAATECGADVVVRVTSDCPLIDPKVVDKVLKAYLEHRADHDGAVNVIDRTYPRGLDVEAVSFSTLETAWKEARQAYHREHVMPYVYENGGRFRLINVTNDKDLSALRWTVDEEEDLLFIRQIYDRIYEPGKVFQMEDVLEVLKKEPHLSGMNEHIRQKAVGE